MLLPRAAPNSACTCSWVARTQVQDLHFTLLNFMRYAQVSSLLGSFWIASLPSSKGTAPQSLMLLANLMRGRSFPLSMCPKKMFNNVSPNTASKEHHSSLISTWTMSHWPQLFECDQSASSLSIAWSTYLIHVCPVWKQGYHETLCTTTGGWHQSSHSFMSVQSINFSRHISVRKGFAYSWRDSRFRSIVFVFSVC